MAIQPDGFRERLPNEVTAWLREDVVDAKTARRILGRYRQPIPQELAEAGRRRGGGFVAYFGAALTGLGILLFVASNWTQIGRAERVVILLTALVTAYGLAHVLRTRGLRRTAAALTAIGTLVFGASVELIGQTYHLAIDDPLLPFLWGAGALAMAAVVTSRLSFIVGVAGIAATYGTLIARWAAYTDTAFLVIAVLTWAMALVAVAVLLSRTEATRPFFGPLVSMAAPFVVVVVMALSFRDGWTSLGSATQTESAPLRASVALAAAILVAVLALLVRTSALGRARAVFFAGAAALVVAGPSALILVHPFSNGTPYAIVMNAFVLATVLVSVFYGISTGRESFINMGIVLFGLTAFARYFDLAFELFDRSLFFIGAGVLLLALGFGLERGRRKILTLPAEAAGVA